MEGDLAVPCLHNSPSPRPTVIRSLHPEEKMRYSCSRRRTLIVPGPILDLMLYAVCVFAALFNTYLSLSLFLILRACWGKIKIISMMRGGKI